ncbi:MAG TPA: ferritin-like domain-containing protein [Puia sp.]
MKSKTVSKSANGFKTRGSADKKQNARVKDRQRENTGRGQQSRASDNDSSPQGESPLEKFFLDQLKDIYYAEQKITRSLPIMQEAATTDELKEAFEDHLHRTERHVKRLEKVFRTLGKKAEGKKCEAIEGIAREVESIIEETEEGTFTRDAALIIAAQKVEHYEIATYGGLVQLAITMKLHDAADLLDKTLTEEEDTDFLLTKIAENEVNLGAEHEGNRYSWDQGHQEEGREDWATGQQAPGNQRQQRQLGETDEENEEDLAEEEGKTGYDDVQ